MWVLTALIYLSKEPNTYLFSLEETFNPSPFRRHIWYWTSPSFGSSRNLSPGRKDCVTNQTSVCEGGWLGPARLRSLPKFHHNSAGASTRFILAGSFLFTSLKVCYKIVFFVVSTFIRVIRVAVQKSSGREKNCSPGPGPSLRQFAAKPAQRQCL